MLPINIIASIHPLLHLTNTRKLKLKIVELKICITDISDSLTLDQNALVSSIITQARDLVAAGGVVTIERRYDNASSDHLVSYSTVEDIDAWKNKLNEVQKTLGCKKID